MFLPRESPIFVQNLYLSTQVDKQSEYGNHDSRKKEAPQPAGGVHMGQNIRIARVVKGYSQEALGLDLNLRQNQVSELEQTQVIRDESLIRQVAHVLDCDVKFIKEYAVENAMRSYDIHDNDNDQTNTAAENSQETIVQGAVDTLTTNNYTYPIDDIKALYEKLIEEKDKQLRRFEKELEEMKARMQEIEKRRK